MFKVTARDSNQGPGSQFVLFPLVHREGWRGHQSQFCPAYFEPIERFTKKSDDNVDFVTMQSQADYQCDLRPPAHLQAAHGGGDTASWVTCPTREQVLWKFPRLTNQVSPPVRGKSE